MKKFTITIIETLQREVEISALSQNQAIEIAQNMHRNSDIILDADDFLDVEFQPSISEIS
jgi:hypothetical protein